MNIAGNLSKRAELDSMGSPFLYTEHTLALHEPLTNGVESFGVAIFCHPSDNLVCHATGRPLPIIIWRREDGKAFHVKNTKRMGKLRFLNVLRLCDYDE